MCVYTKKCKRDSANNFVVEVHHMLKKRQREILNILEKSNEYLTIEYISQVIGVSKRTIHSEIRILDEYIQNLGKYIDKKRGVGIKLVDISSNNMYLKRNNMLNTVNDVFDRRLEIMETLLFDRKIVSFNQLSEKYLVSKTSIDNDLDSIMKYLQVGSDIRLESNIKGTRLVGSEVDFQQALLQFNRYVLRNENINKKEILSKYYGEEVVKTCSQILYKYMRQNLTMITDYYVQNILNIFIILIFELKHDRHVKYSNSSRVSKDNKSFDIHAEKLLSCVCNKLNYQYSKKDVQFFSENLVLNRFDILEEDTYREVAKSIIESISKSLRVELDNEQELLIQLLEHIPLMIYRLKFNYKTDNPFTDQIKTEFPLTFQNIWLVLSEYEEILDIRFNEDEIAMLTIYFQSVIERYKLNRKILIVCPMGIATSALIKNRLRNILSTVDLIEISSIEDFKNLECENWDLIISTVDLDEVNEKVLYVSPFLTDLDINRIKEFLNIKSSNSKQLFSEKIKTLSKYISNETIFLNTNFTSKDQLIDDIGKYLTNLGKVNKDFIFDIRSRELLGGTDLPIGVAVPHGNPSNVIDTNVAIIKNKKKFKWDKYYIDIVFLIGIAKKDSNKTRAILSDIYSIINNPNILQEMRRINKIENLVNLIGE